MAKKKSSSKTFNISFGYWSEYDTIRECQNLAKWNPHLAIQLMEGISNKVSSKGEILVNAYNRAVTNINNYLDSLEKMRYYSKNKYWGQEKNRRLENLTSSYNNLEVLKLAHKINQNLSC